MKNSATLSLHGMLIEPTTLKIQRRLPGPIERMWSYLTDSDLRKQWLAAGIMEERVNAPVELVWRNDELTRPAGQRPAGFPEEQRMQSRVIEIDPPHKLVIAWGEAGQVSFELTLVQDEVLLTLVHHRLPENPEIMLHIQAGWHTHLDTLVARINGNAPKPFWEEWGRMRKVYELQRSI
jgi:uncharacterized protein YndB with AHSA1/START domain